MSYVHEDLYQDTNYGLMDNIVSDCCHRLQDLVTEEEYRSFETFTDELPLCDKIMVALELENEVLNNLISSPDENTNENIFV